MPVASTSMLAELATHPPEYLFLQQSELQPQAPLLTEVLPQPQLSQAKLIAMRSVRADLDKMRLAMEVQGQMLVSVSSRKHTAEVKVRS